MRETILLFGGEEALTAHVQRAAAPLKVRVKFIPPEEYGNSLGYLAGDHSCPQAREPWAGGPVEQPLLLLAGMTGDKMGRVLDALRRHGLYIDYKAMLTPTNRFWDVPALYEEIAREHRQLQENGAAADAQTED